jgi:hypothetical protein
LDAAELNVRGNGGDHEELGHRYHRRSIASKFFAFGRVLTMVWHEGVGDRKGGHLRQAELFNPQRNSKKRGKYNEEVFSHIRRMIVVESREWFCSCLPINTHNYQGVAKKGFSPEHRQAPSVIYMYDTKPAIHPTEKGWIFKPANFEQKCSTTPLRPVALAGFGGVG